MKTLTEVLAAFPAEVRQRYDFSNAQYLGATVRITGVVCPDHGEFSQYAARFRKGAGCPSCGGVQRSRTRALTQEQFIAGATERTNGKYTYANTRYVRMADKVTVTCPVHGDFEITALKHYYEGQGCPSCNQEALRTRIVQYRHLSAQAKVANTAADFFERCAEAHDGKYSYPEQQYRGAKEKIRVVCPVHGEFEQAAWSHLSGSGCAACGGSDPLWEREMTALLRGWGFEPQRNVPLFEGRHADIYLPNEQFAIELHGLHWHTERTRGRMYHREKWESAVKQGIRLIQVFDDEWRDRRGVIESRLAAMLGRALTYDARKGDIEVLQPRDGHAFLEATHLQGSGSARIFYGLRVAGELVAVASFGKSRSGAMTGARQDGVWEVLRYASVGRVRGGFSRLFARFRKDFSVKSVVSYCDLRYGDGRLYQACGFELERVTEPDYWWVPQGKSQRVPRYQTQKHKLITHPLLGQHYDPTKSEVEICHAAGWQRVYGVGHQKWVWTP